MNCMHVKYCHCIIHHVATRCIPSLRPHVTVLGSPPVQDEWLVFLRAGDPAAVPVCRGDRALRRYTEHIVSGAWELGTYEQPNGRVKLNWAGRPGLIGCILYSAYSSLFMSIPVSYSLFKNKSAYYNRFQPPQAVWSLFKPRPPNSRIFQHYQAYSEIYLCIVQNIPAYASIFQNIHAFPSLFLPIQAYSSHPMSAYMNTLSLNMRLKGFNQILCGSSSEDRWGSQKLRCFTH